MALNYLLESYSASRILISGDSAGGHLAVDLLMHILQQHFDPAVPKINLKAGQKLNSAFLMSPWIKHGVSSAAYVRNARKDVLAAAALIRWSAAFTGAKPLDEYIDPLTAPRELWKGLNDIVERVYITSGSSEVFVDDIADFHEVLKAEWTGVIANIQYFEAANEVHDGILCERMLGMKDVKSVAVIRKWFEDAIST